MSACVRTTTRTPARSQRVSPSEPWGWPDRPLARVPTNAGAAKMAVRAREATPGTGPSDPLDIYAVCAAAGVSVREAPLGGHVGQLEALLVPIDKNRFGVTVDPTPLGGWESVPATTRVALRRHRLRFRVAHELGHTFFYWRGGDEPRRHLLGSAAQERFCDAFARALLIPSTAVEGTEPTVAGVLNLQERFDVSLQVAARAIADAQTIEVGLWFGASPDQLTRQWSTPALAEQAPPVRDAHSRWLVERRQLLYVS